MDVFSNSSFDHHEQLSFFADRETGLRAIVAIHDRVPTNEAADAIGRARIAAARGNPVAG